MIDALHLPAAPDRYRAPALQGILVARPGRDISVRVTEGTWTFRRDDAFDIRETDSYAPGQPVPVDIRPGATADFTRRLRIDIVGRPMTLAAPPSEAFGDDQLRRLTEAWTDRLRIADSPATGATFTFCQTKPMDGSDDGVNRDSLY
ncbi:hypothetical protein [Nocardia brevicatena]|uniref:hypothetical protein n=1 Tax=Nocardia brevicatena TaxID=37327 RepID=UPI0002FCC07C|nr:hypothetical protein [Nocardia brevicatena]